MLIKKLFMKDESHKKMFVYLFVAAKSINGQLAVNRRKESIKESSI